MKELLLKQLSNLVRNIDGRNRTERIAVLGISLIVLGLGYLLFVSDPMRAGIERIQAQMTSVERQISAQKLTHAEMIAASEEDPSRFANDRLLVVQRELEQLDAEISSLAGDLVSPSEMTEVLSSVLGNFDGLELVSFQNVPATPLRAEVGGGLLANAGASIFGEVAANNGDGQVYAHGLRLEFQGDFFTTLKYLRFLEEIGGSFFWDTISFQQLEWPTARITLEIHTLSTDEGFIGV